MRRNRRAQAAIKGKLIIFVLFPAKRSLKKSRKSLLDNKEGELVNWLIQFLIKGFHCRFVPEFLSFFLRLFHGLVGENWYLFEVF